MATLGEGGTRKRLLSLGCSLGARTAATHHSISRSPPGAVLASVRAPFTCEEVKVRLRGESWPATEDGSGTAVRLYGCVRYHHSLQHFFPEPLKLPLLSPKVNKQNPRHRKITRRELPMWLGWSLSASFPGSRFPAAGCFVFLFFPCECGLFATSLTSSFPTVLPWLGIRCV